MPKLLFPCLVTIGIGLGLLATHFAPPTKPQAIEWLKSPRPINQFQLTRALNRHEKDSFNKTSLVGRWTVAMFGFTHCPDTCPTGLAQLVKLKQSIASDPYGPAVSILFVSVDPLRDSPRHLQDYLMHFDPTITGVTGRTPQLEHLADSLGVTFRVIPDSDNYRVSHSSTISIIGPKAQLRGRFRQGFDPQQVATDLASTIGATQI
ncbi:MAG: SCO family protein [Pseudomonadota bacterium]